MARVFDGITVLDFTSGRAGGVATMVMSDFGAEVIKVEPPGGEKFKNAPGSIQWKPRQEKHSPRPEDPRRTG